MRKRKHSRGITDPRGATKTKIFSKETLQVQPKKNLSKETLEVQRSTQEAEQTLELQIKKHSNERTDRAALGERTL